jgi:hypothetical protein
VEGFSHCAFKSFKTEHEAKQYLAHGMESSSPTVGDEHANYRQRDDFPARTSSQKGGREQDMAVNYDMAASSHEMAVERNDAVHYPQSSSQTRGHVNEMAASSPKGGT